jgi:hypothetical protein
MNDLDLFKLSFNLIATLSFLITLYITLRLWILTKKERYWIGFPIAIFFFILHELIETAGVFFGYNQDVIAGIQLGNFEEVFEVIGSIFLIYAAYGLSKILANVNKILEEEEQLENH